MKKPNNAKPMEKAMACVEAFRSTGTKTDVQGSYTGTFKTAPEFYKNAGAMAMPLYTSSDYAMILEDDKRPVQDADDL